MIDFTIDTDIERAPSDVFAYATDPAKLATWQTNTVSAVQEDDGPMRVGRALPRVRAPTGAMRLAQPVLSRTLRKQFAQHCATLKQVLEG